MSDFSCDKLMQWVVTVRESVCVLPVPIFQGLVLQGREAACVYASVCMQVCVRTCVCVSVHVYRII